MNQRHISRLIILLTLLMTACTGGNTAKADDLQGYSWRLLHLNGQQAPKDHRPTLEFQGEQISGNAGCNHYGGRYQVQGDAIQLENLFGTEMACLEPAGIMEQEQTYLALLQAVNRFERANSELTLFTETGEQLVFTNQPPDALAGVTPTPEPAPPTHTPVVMPPTEPPPFEPPTGFKAYHDAAAGISIYLPESWVVTSVIPGQSAILQSYSPDKYVGGEGFAPGDAKCDLNIRPAGSRAAELIDQWRSDAMTTIVSESAFNFPDGRAGQRFVIDSMGRATVFIGEINQRTVLLTCFGDFTQVDAIAATLKALE